tara:strand:- start:155543 stop:157060 length:1518 start_codon:yes stop_codon:yes gene_type:complete
MANLTGNPIPVEIAPGGYSLQAPGLKGTITELGQDTAATRGDSGAYALSLQQAAKAADVFELKVFAIDVREVDTAGSSATRGATSLVTADGEPAISLRVPRLQADAEQLVLYTDEAGVSRWIFPVGGGTTGAPATRGAGGDVEFLLPRDVAPAPATLSAETATRGVLTKLGRRLVRVLAWATKDIIGKGAMYVASRWEEEKRPYGLRRFPFDDTKPIAWDSLSSGRALLLIHGTFSTAQSAFSLIPAATISALRKIYGDRMFAFDHPTVHVSPRDNVRKLFEMMPGGTELDVDLITHSRGGLVGRELIENAGECASPNRKLTVRRAVFVAGPMRGTVLTDTRHGIQMLDRYTNLFTDLPDGPFTIGMEALFMLAKLTYHGAVSTLPGLNSMYPPGEYLQYLNRDTRNTAEYYALSSDFKPRAEGLLARFGWAVADAAVDGIFGEANDGVVPTSGSYELSHAAGGFPIDADHRAVFAKTQAVHHLNYFAAPETSRHLLYWLGNGAG